MLSSTARYLWALLKPGQAVTSLPALSSRSTVQLNTAHLNAYCERYRLAATESVPLPYLYLSVQPALLKLMTTPAFPSKPAGLVHLAAEFEWCAQVPVDTELNIGLTLSALTSTCKGRLLSVEADVSDAEQTLVRMQHHFLDRRWALASAPALPNWIEPSVWSSECCGRATFAVSLRDTRAYAALSGDYNPIHLSRLAARLFGQPQPLMHGMDLLSRCWAETQCQLAQPIRYAQVQFYAPVRLPASLHFDYQLAGSQLQGQVRAAGDGRRHLQFYAASALQ